LNSGKIIGSVVALTLHDIKEKLKQLDEITLMETLDISSEDLVNRFVDRIEEKQDVLENDLDDSTPWDND
jgi:hypothetical protein